MNEDFSDVTLVTEDKRQIKANISILCASSSVFKDILKKEKNSSTLMYLRGIQYSELESIMQFIYLGEATFYEERMDEFLAVAKSLEIKELCYAETERNEPDDEPSISDQLPSIEKFGEQTVISDFVTEQEEEGVVSVDIKYEDSDEDPVTIRADASRKNAWSHLDWKEKVTYDSARDYHESPVFAEIKDQYTLKRKHDLEYGESQHFRCKFSRRKKYVKCTHEYKIIFPATDQSVIVQEAGAHLHQRNEDYVSTSAGFCWSISATEVVINGIKASSTPKVILCSLRDQGCFPDGVEPTKIQLYNKIAHVKKVYLENC